MVKNLIIASNFLCSSNDVDSFHATSLWDTVTILFFQHL